MRYTLGCGEIQTDLPRTMPYNPVVNNGKPTYAPLESVPSPAIPLRASEDNSTTPPAAPSPRAMGPVVPRGVIWRAQEQDVVEPRFNHECTPDTAYCPSAQAPAKEILPPSAPANRRMGPRSQLEQLMNMPIKLNGARFRSNRAMFSEPHVLAGATLGVALDYNNATYAVTHYENDLAILQYAKKVVQDYPGSSDAAGLTTMVESYDAHTFASEVSQLYTMSKVYLQNGGDFDVNASWFDALKSLDIMGAEVKSLADSVLGSAGGAPGGPLPPVAAMGPTPATQANAPMADQPPVQTTVIPIVLQPYASEGPSATSAGELFGGLALLAAVGAGLWAIS